MLKILVVDNSEIFVRETLESFHRWGWSAEGALDRNRAIAALSETQFDGVLLDRRGVSGDEILQWIRVDAPKDPKLRTNVQDLCVVVLTAYGDVRSAVEALKRGAFQYLLKPIEEPAYLRAILAAGIAWHRAHAMRRELLVTDDPHELLARVRDVLIESLRPDGVHIITTDEDGVINGIVTDSGAVVVDHGLRFVERIVEGEQLVFEQGDPATRALGPILPDVKTLMAVPIPGPNRTVAGVLEIESTTERAFDPCWSEVLAYLGDLIGISLEIEKQNRRRLAAEREKVTQLGLLYREFRHNVATHAQIVSMQARELMETDLVTLSNEHNPRIRERLSYIRDNAEIIESVVQDIKALSLNPPRPNLAMVDVPTVVRESIEAFRPRLAPGVELSLSHSPAELNIQADRANLAYCVKCLIQNAVEAIEEARRTAVEPRPAAADRIELRIAEDNGSVRITVADSGIGFDLPADELFRPLFSTKTRHAMTDAKSEEARGAERVERVLEFLSKWSAMQPEVLEGVRRGADILIRDGDPLVMYVREGHAGDATSIGELMKTATARITTHRLSDDWPNRGVGLHSVRRIVEEMHGGRMTAASHGFGKGAAFTMTLPKLL